MKNHASHIMSLKNAIAVVVYGKIFVAAPAYLGVTLNV
jgi:hypothetical protein